MKRGDKVAVCHDGKWSRRIQGEVLETRNGHHLKIRFFHPGTGALVEFWARKSPTVRHRRQKLPSCIQYGKRYAYFAGWADIDWFCPWFAVHKWPKAESLPSA